MAFWRAKTATLNVGFATFVRSCLGKLPRVSAVTCSSQVVKMYHCHVHRGQKLMRSSQLHCVYVPLVTFTLLYVGAIQRRTPSCCALSMVYAHVLDASGLEFESRLFDFVRFNHQAAFVLLGLDLAQHKTRSGTVIDQYSSGSCAFISLQHLLSGLFV